MDSNYQEADYSPSSTVRAAANRLQLFAANPMNTRSSGRNSPARSVVSQDSRRSSIDNQMAVGGGDIDYDRPAKRSRIASQRALPGIRSQLSQEESFSPPLMNGQSDAPQITIEPASAIEKAADASFGTPASQPVVEDGLLDIDEMRELAPSPAPRSRGRGRGRGRGGRGRGRGRGRWANYTRMASRAVTPAESALGTPAPGTPYNGLDHGTGANTDQELNKPARRLLGKRLPGRRRAENPNISIEADLRRQLVLKMAYRSVAKVLKPVLDELATRTIEDLEENEESFKAHEQYQDIMDELDRRLEKRLKYLDALRRIELEMAETREQKDEEYLRMWFKVSTMAQ
jgi:hypothetical protein